MCFFFLSPWLLACACYVWYFSLCCVWSDDGSAEPTILQLDSHSSARGGGRGRVDVRSSCGASWRQAFVQPPLLGRRRQSWTRCLLFHMWCGVCSGKKEGPMLSLPLPLSALLLCLHLMHLWLSPSWLQFRDTHPSSCCLCSFRFVAGIKKIYFRKTVCWAKIFILLPSCVESRPQLLCVMLLISTWSLTHDCFWYSTRSFGLRHMAFKQEANFVSSFSHSLSQRDPTKGTPSF